MTKKFIIILCLATSMLVVGFTTAGEEPQSGLDVGIQVHGHWKLEVFEADGTPVSVHEFDNAFDSNANVALSRLLSRYFVVKNWSVLLDGSTLRPCLQAGSPASCVLMEPGTGSGLSNEFDNLTLSTPGGLQLSGTATAAATTNITSVTTTLSFCNNTVPPGANCTPYHSGTVFTGTTLTPPGVAVLPGQLVQVTVTINFS